jgi:hypothetical protein
MKFLVCCNHEKRTVVADNPDEAAKMCECLKCVFFDLKQSKHIYRDVRVYSEEKDIVAKSINTREKYKVMPEQLDWVGK